MKVSKLLFLLGVCIISTLFSTRAFAYSITSFATVGFHPLEMTTDAAGNFYVVNNGASTVSKITPAGVVTLLGTTGTNPQGIVVDSSGNVFVANFSDDTVTKITPAGVSSVFASVGHHPHQMTIDASDNLYVANNGTWTVSKVTPAGVMTTLGSTGSAPIGITIDAAGNVYTANQLSNSVTKITAAGVSTTLGATDSFPYGIAIDPAGNIYTANLGSNTVTKITPAGVSSTLGTTATSPVLILADASGNVYVTNNGSNTVTKISAAGVSTTFGYTGVSPFGITMDASGNLYTANYVSGSVTKIIAPTISEITPVATPTIDTTPNYVFTATTDVPANITYGGSCSSATTSAVLGSNTITFNTLAVGTYSDCTITVTDGFGDSNTLSVPSFTIVQSLLLPDMTAGTDLGVSNTDNITSNTTPTFTGICTNGETVEVEVDSVGILPTAVCAGGAYSITPATPLTTGAHSITSTLTSVPGNPVSSALTVTIDTGAPLLSVNVDSTGVYTADTPNISFSATDALSGIDHYEVTYFSDNGAGGIGAPVTVNPATSPLPLSLDADEVPHVISITAYDIAGNSATTTTRFVPVVTITAPTVISKVAVQNTTFTVTTPTGNDIDSIALSGAAAAGASVSCIGFGGDLVSPYASPVACSVSNISSTGTLTISARDAVNLATGNNSRSYIIDTTAPTLSFTDDVVAGPVQLDTVTITTSDAYPDTASYIYGLSADAICNAADTFTTAFSNGVPFTIANEASNGKYICVRVTDLAGNITYLSSANPVNVDITPPTIVLSTPAVAPVIAPITITITPSETISEFTISDISVTGGSKSAFTGPDGSGNYTITVTPTATGTLTISLPAGVGFPTGVLDAANNRQTVSSNTLMFAAYISPAAPLTAPDMTTGTDTGSSNTDNNTSNTTPTFTGSCTTGETITLKVDGVGVLPTQVCAGAAYSITPSTGLTDGTYAITIAVSNPAGTSSDSPSLVVTIDTTAPVATGTPDMTAGFDTGSSSTDDNTATTTPAFTLSCVTGTTVKLYSGVTLIGSGTCAASTVTITAAPAFADGTYSITGTQTDTAGNVSVASSGLSITIDTTVTAPTSTITATSSTGGMATGSCETGSIVSLTGTNIVPSPTTVLCAGGTYSVSIVTTLNPTTIHTSQIDIAGNSSTSVDSTFQYVAPASGGGGGGHYIAPSYPVTQPVASTTTSLPVSTSGICTPLLTKNIQFGKTNDPVEVNLLIAFLNQSEGQHLALDGSYDQDDLVAVKAFQTKYASQIITPWGGTTATGMVSTFTRGKINVMHCATLTSCPYFTQYLKPATDVTSTDTARIKNFLTLLTGKEPTNLDGAVKSFQTLYKDTVLKPWGLKAATGYWFKTTRYAANQIMGCSDTSTMQ